MTNLVMEQIAAYLPLVLGVAAFVVSAIVELTKDLGILKKLPTKTWAIVVSLVVCVSAYFAYAGYKGLSVVWYEVFTTIVASFLVAYISTYGWDTFNQLWTRFKK